jgi:hypothetical protein
MHFSFMILIWLLFAFHVISGNYVIVELVDRKSGSKLGGEIVHVLLDEHVRQLKKSELWWVGQA